MNATEISEMSEVLSRVNTWMPGMRIVLARQILETLESPKISVPPRTMSLMIRQKLNEASNDGVC